MRTLDPKGLAGELVARARATAERTPGSRGSRPVRPGDLYTLAEAGDFAGEWAVVERRPRQPGHWWLVPADTLPVAGGGDLTVPADAPGGPLTLRCGYGVWVAETVLRPESWSGEIDPAWMARAREIAERLEEPAESELPDPELEAWLAEEVAPAREALVRSAVAPGEMEERATERPGRFVARRSRRAGWWTWISRSAAALLLVGLGAGGGRQEGKRTGEASTRHALEAGSARQLTQVKTALEGERSKAQALELLAEERRRQLEALAVSGPESVVVLLPIEETLRGKEETVARQWPRLTVALELAGGVLFTRYRAEIERGGRRIASIDGLSRDRSSRVSFSVPSKLVSPGQYEIHLYGLRGKQLEKVADYPLTVE